MELERTLFFFSFFFYIPFFRGSETQEKDQSEKEEDNVLLEYLFTIWESHRIVDHIRRRRLVDGGGPGLLVSPSHIFLTFFYERPKKFLFGADGVLHKHVITIIKKKEYRNLLFSSNFLEMLLLLRYCLVLDDKKMFETEKKRRMEC